MKAKDKIQAKDKELFDVCDPFARAASIFDGLMLTNNIPLRDVLPGVWPTVGDIRRLRDEMQRLGWTNKYKRMLRTQIVPE